MNPEYKLTVNGKTHIFYCLKDLRDYCFRQGLKAEKIKRKSYTAIYGLGNGRRKNEKW